MVRPRFGENNRYRYFSRPVLLLEDQWKKDFYGRCDVYPKT